MSKSLGLAYEAHRQMIIDELYDLLCSMRYRS